ncbi:MAG: two-component system chemotaxis response regulator CheV [Psychroserpens sp.]|jgi:two-component system chemotaxis response regulator CheV
MQNEKESQSLLLFQLNNTQLFGLNVLKIKEIVTFSSLNQLPDSHPALAGVAELRGVTLPVVDLGVAMGLSAIKTSSEHLPSIVVTECNGKNQGFLVRKVANIIPINWNDISAIPKASGNNHYATGVISINEKLVTLIDFERIIHETTDTEDDSSSELLTKTQLSYIKGKKLLVVDDSLIARKKIASILDDLGLKYQLVDSAIGALSQLNETSTPFDMIISDIEMPQMDGYEFSRKVRDLPNHANTYTLLHTTLSVTPQNKDFQESKADALLTKFVPQALADNIYQGLSKPHN